VPNEESEYENRAAERLIFFSDAVVAIAITLLAIDLPVPSGATVADFWSSAREHDGVYLSFLVSFVTIAAAWSHHHDALKYVRRTDARLRNLTMIWLLMIVLIPFATKLLTGYEHHAVGVHALRWGFYALLQTVAAGALLAIGRHLASRGLEAEHAAGRAVDRTDWQSYGAMLGFGLSIPVFFVTAYGWVLWIAAPMLTGQVERLRRRRGAVGSDGRDGAADL
jgi:uncharacterized membrane protein